MSKRLNPFDKFERIVRRRIEQGRAIYIGSFRDPYDEGRINSISYRYRIQLSLYPGQEDLLRIVLQEILSNRDRYSNNHIRIRVFQNSLDDELMTGGSITRIAPFITRDENYIPYVDSGFHYDINEAINRVMQKVLEVLNNYHGQSFQAGEIVITVIERNELEELNRGKVVGFGELGYTIMKDNEWIFVELTNHESKFNCMWIALAIGKGWRDNPDYLTGYERFVQKSGYNLKRFVHKKLGDNFISDWKNRGVAIKDLQPIVDVLEIPVHVLNNEKKVIKIFKPKRQKFSYEIFIQKVGSHVRCVIPKNDIKQVYPWFVFQDEVEGVLYKKLIYWYGEKNHNQRRRKKVNWRKMIVRPILLLKNMKFFYKNQIFENELFLEAYIDMEKQIYKDFSLQIQSSEECHTQSTVIKPMEDNREKLNRKIGSLDIEAFLKPIVQTEKEDDNTRGVFKTYAVGFAYFDDDNDVIYKNFFGLHCLYQLMDYLWINRSTLNGYSIYWHNGGKFDALLLLREYLLLNDQKWFIPTEESKSSMLHSNGRFMVLEIRSKDGCSIVFRDSFCLLSKSLATLCKDFQVEHQKTTLDHDAINQNNYYDYKDEVLKYLKNDVLGLLEVMDSLNKLFVEDIRIGFNIMNCVSAAHAARKVFFRKYYKPNNGLKNAYGMAPEYEYAPLYNLGSKEDEFVRNAYFGGRTEAWFIGNKKGKFYFFDVTSEYPHVGRNLLPCGEPKWRTYENVYRQYRNDDTNEINFNPTADFSFFGFVECKVRNLNVNDKRIRLHGIKVNGKLMFPTFDKWTKVTLFSPEIHIGMKEKMYQYDFKDARFLEFSRGYVMRDYFNDMYTLKSNADTATKRGLFKLLLNAAYGGFGMRKIREMIKIMLSREQSLAPYLNEGQLLDYQFGKIYDLIKVRMEINASTISVPVAAAITSYARCYFWQIATDIQTAGGNILYGDTDSFLTDYDIISDKKLYEKYCKNNGKDMGELKDEGADLLKLQNMEKGVYFDEIYIHGLKMYGCYKYDDKGKIICSKQGCKGFKKGDESVDIIENEDRSLWKTTQFTNLENEILAQNGTLLNPQMQFVCGNTGLLHKNGEIVRKDIEKEINQCYDKGKVNQDGSVTPWTMTEIEKGLPQEQLQLFMNKNFWL